MSDDLYTHPYVSTMVQLTDNERCLDAAGAHFRAHQPDEFKANETAGSAEVAAPVLHGGEL